MNLLLLSTILLVRSVVGQGGRYFKSILLDEVTNAAKLYFSKNPNPDATGFNFIDADEEWSATDLFKKQYGATASTARFVAAILDFEYYVPRNMSYSDVTQLITVGEHQDARMAFAEHARDVVDDLVEANNTVAKANVEEVSKKIRLRFSSVYDVVGNESFASFLNLRVGSSLSFIMDTTGSMGDEIEAAKAEVIDIIDSTRGTNSAPLNYVLMPYNDPGTGPVTKTTSPDEFKARVNALFAVGGGDAPELAMKGILVAAENSGFRSLMYVFTDAPAKDTLLQNQVIAVCLVKKASVNIFLTEEIGTGTTRGLLTERALYDKIAEQTGGSVMLVKKTAIESATEVMKATTVQGLVMLLSISQTSASSLSVNVDSSVKSLLVQFNGEFSYRNYESTAAGSGKVVSLVSIPGSIELFRIDDISPGKYTFDFYGADDRYGALIRGESGLGFHAHLSQKKRGHDTYSSSRSLQAKKLTIANITVYGDAENALFTRFQLVSREGIVLFETALKKIDTSKYNVETPFALPDKPMLVKLTGTVNGEIMERVDPCAITPIVSDSYIEEIHHLTMKAGTTQLVNTTLHNFGSIDEFFVRVSDSKGYVTVDEAAFAMMLSQQKTISLTVSVPEGTELGVLSKVVLTATAVNGNYFVFTTFVVSVVDDVTRCDSPVSPEGGYLSCIPDGRSVGSVCTLTCEAEYVADGPGSIQCQRDGTWNADVGLCKYLGSKTCSIGGGGHYTTFDGFSFGFFGSCLYRLVETRTSSGIAPVTITTECSPLYKGSSLSWFKQGFITVYDTTIHMKRRKVVLIDGIKITLPASLNDGKLQIKIDGPDVLLTTDFKLQVRYDGDYFFRVTLPASYRGKLTRSMCGNYDGSDSNELSIEGKNYTNAATFANDLEVPGGSKPWCRKGDPDREGDRCVSKAERALFAERCQAMESECFKKCARNDTNKVDFKSCIHDMCGTGGKDHTLVEALDNLAQKCAEDGAEICDWRKEFKFPKTCKQNSHYEARGNRCPNTCVDKKASYRCLHKPKAELCVCNQGYFLDGTRCVHESDCGCTSHGRYYKKGEVTINSICTEKCECSSGAMICSHMTCEEGYECRILPTEIYGCQLKRTDHCRVTGYAHVHTFDGSTFDFRGKCRYVLLQSEKSSLDSVRKDIVISAQFDYQGNSSASSVRSVIIDLPSNHLAVQLGPGLTIWRTASVKKDSDGAWEDMTSQGRFENGGYVVEKIGFVVKFRNSFGVQVIFDDTNLYISLPSYYMRKVTGLCGNYNEDQSDDIHGANIAQKAMTYLDPDACEEVVKETTCTDADKKLATNSCDGIQNDTAPLRYCFEDVDVRSYQQDCVLDECATGNNKNAYKKSVSAYAQHCLDIGVELPCNWKTQMRLEPKCPHNSHYEGCASYCYDTCQGPDATARCETSETEGKCVCDAGFLLEGVECIPSSTCGCIYKGRYVSHNYVMMVPNCAYSETCVAPNVIDHVKDPCDENHECKEQKDGEFACVTKELSHVLVYAGSHYKTFDDKYYDFQGDCSYLIAGYKNDDLREGVPSFKIFVKNQEKVSGTGVTGVEEIIIEVNSTSVDVIRLKKGKIVLVNDVQVGIGSDFGWFEISLRNGKVAVDFKFEVHVLYDGNDWLRIDVDHAYKGMMLFGMGGDYNGVPGDDFTDGNETFKTSQKWGDHWYTEHYSPDKCSKRTPEFKKTCRFGDRYERDNDCGLISNPDGPFSKCHGKLDPKPFLESCVFDACVHNGSPEAIEKVITTYYLACLGKRIKIENWRNNASFPKECPPHSHYEECVTPCQPTCDVKNRTGDEKCVSTVCEEGCVCDDGYILSSGKCVSKEHCGCRTDHGLFIEHGSCDCSTNCTKRCVCLSGEWDCEEYSCYKDQYCGILNGVRECHWKDQCVYDKGGCSHICTWENGKVSCSCPPGHVLGKDDKTCFEMSGGFFWKNTDGCGAMFNAWKTEFLSWRNEYLPELQSFRKYVRDGIKSAAICDLEYSWTRWFDRDDPRGYGDEEKLAFIHRDYPGEVCEKPLAAEGRMADGRKIGFVIANFTVAAEEGLVCRNVDQEYGKRCPDFAVRFLCPASASP